MPIDSNEQVLSTIQSIPFGNIIGGPLKACILAQADATKTTFDYIKQTAFNKSDVEDGAFDPATVSFTFVIDGAKKIMVVPLLTIIPVPYISIEHVDLSFTANVTASQDNKLEAHYTAPRRNIDETEDMTADFENLIEVDIHATTADMPSGLARILDIFNNQLIQTEIVETEELIRQREEERRKKEAAEEDERKRKAEEERKKAEEEAARQKAEEERKAAEKQERDKVLGQILVDVITARMKSGGNEQSSPNQTKPNQDPTQSEREKLMLMYQQAVDNGDAAQVKTLRNTMKTVLGLSGATRILRGADRPDAKLPFLIRASKTMAEHPNCEYDPSLSIRQNIHQLSRKQHGSDDVLRAQLIYALETALKMYPYNSQDTTGRNALNNALNKYKNRTNGWYTFGGTDINSAFTTFVDHVVANEKSRSNAASKASANSRPASNTVTRPTSNTFTRPSTSNTSTNGSGQQTLASRRGGTRRR